MIYIRTQRVLFPRKCRKPCRLNREKKEEMRKELQVWYIRARGVPREGCGMLLWIREKIRETLPSYLLLALKEQGTRLSRSVKGQSVRKRWGKGDESVFGRMNPLIKTYLLDWEGVKANPLPPSCLFRTLQSLTLSDRRWGGGGGETKRRGCLWGSGAPQSPKPTA